MNLPELGRSVFEVFQEAGIPLILAGGWAVNHYGYSRHTRDIDWICRRSDEPAAKDLMASVGMAVTFEAMATRFHHPKHLTAPPIDLLWVDDETFRKLAAAADFATTRKDIPVVGFRELLIMKIAALDNDRNRHGKDVLDLRSLLGQHPEKIAEEELQQLCRHYGPPGAYDFIRMNS